MIFLTHLAFGLLLGFLYLKNAPVGIGAGGFLSVVLLASLFPDIDRGTTFLGKFFRPLNSFLEHRAFFHSIFCMVVCAVAINYFFHAPDYAIAFMVGFSSHIIMDSLTKSGVLVFWPSRLIVRGPFKTGGLMDMLIFVLTIALLLYSLHSYGITQIGSII